MTDSLAAVDPAWFYTAIAQVTAAIVGLIGAVLGSRLIDQYNQMMIKKRKVNKYILRLKNRVHGQHNQLTEISKYLTTVLTYFREHGQLPTTLNYYVTWGGSGGGGIHSVQGWATDTEMQNDLNLIPSIQKEFLELKGKICLEELDLWSNRIELYKSQVKGYRAEEILGSYKSEIEGVKQEILHFKNQLLPASFWWMGVVFVWMCLTGIIWPLTKLRGFWEFSPQAMILGCFLFGLISIFVIFGMQFYEIGNIKNFSWNVHPDDVDKT